MLIMTISGTNMHFSLVGPRSRSQLLMEGAYIIFSDGLSSLYFLNIQVSQPKTDYINAEH